MTAFVVFFFPILIFLGSWQIVRGLEKEDIVNRHYENKSLPVISEKEMATLNLENLIYRTVNLEGEYRPESYILDNRLYRQEAGYEVFTAFETSEKNLFLVIGDGLQKKILITMRIFIPVKVRLRFKVFCHPLKDLD